MHVAIIQDARSGAWRNSILMKKILKVSLWAVGSLGTVVSLAIAALYINSERRLDRVIDVAVAAVPYASGPQSLEHGKYLYLTRCSECHGTDGSGRVFIDEPNGLHISGANLTRVTGGPVSNYTERDWVRAIRHGIKPNGRPTFIMPSEDFNRLSDPDLADVVAYVRSLPPKDGPGKVIRLPLFVKLAYGAGVLKDAAEKIDHSIPPSPPVAVGVTAEHGRYVAQSCIGCHGRDLRGGPIVGAPPDWPAAATLVGASSVFARYERAEQFKAMLRTRTRPDGTKANAAMPVNEHLSDTDLEAMFLYFKSTQTARSN